MARCDSFPPAPDGSTHLAGVASSSAWHPAMNKSIDVSTLYIAWHTHIASRGTCAPILTLPAGRDRAEKQENGGPPHPPHVRQARMDLLLLLQLRIRSLQHGVAAHVRFEAGDRCLGALSTVTHSNAAKVPPPALLPVPRGLRLPVRNSRTVLHYSPRLTPRRKPVCESAW